MIRLDQDGVIADFVRGWERLYGIPPIYDDPVLVGRWNFMRVTGAPTPWHRDCGYEFYRDLPPTRDADELVAALEATGIPITILTASETPAMHAGKVAWLAKHYPQFLGRVEFEVRKGDAALPGDVLVDDADHNVDAFVRGGGHAVLVPRIWNSLHHYHHLPAADHLRRVFDTTREKRCDR